MVSIMRTVEYGGPDLDQTPPLEWADSIKLLRFLVRTKRNGEFIIPREGDRASIERHLSRYEGGRT